MTVEQKEQLIAFLEEKIQGERSFVYWNNPLRCIIPSKLDKIWLEHSDQYLTPITSKSGVATIHIDFRVERLKEDLRNIHEKDYLVTTQT